MKKISFLLFLLFAAIYSFAQVGQMISLQDVSPARNGIVLFDKGWHFKKDSLVDAQRPGFDDATWRRVELPHDWSIEDLDQQVPGETSGPFDVKSIGGTATGFVVGGTGWYRKKFRLEPALQKKQVSLYFDGVYMVSDVWLNGHHLGTHPYGYTPFFYDLTPWLLPAGKENVIAVKVQNTGKNSRWYSGSGIYRHVWLRAAEPLHIAQWGVSVTTPHITAGEALVQVNTKLENEQLRKGNSILRILIKTQDGKTAESTQIAVSAQHQGEITRQVHLAAPRLWSVEHPNLYTAVVQVLDGASLVDQQTVTFGIRTLSFSPNGFLLNGKQVKLKGGCMHHDNGPLGAATIDRAEERKIEILKKNGFNAIRTSHNPPSRQLLDACDRLGMLVIDEAFDMWERPKNPQDYHLYFDEWWQRDLTAMLLRDRNHPSIILWSVGNEINERADTIGLATRKNLIGQVKQLDVTRPVTEAICSFWDHPGRKWEATAPAFAQLDIGGYNYTRGQYRPDHAAFPGRMMIGTESVPKEAYENWSSVESDPFVLGDFVWTAWDYMGETAIGHSIYNNRKDSFSFGWPWYNAWCGDIDLTGQKKPQSYYRDIVWRQSPVEMLVHEPVKDTLKERVSYWGWPQETRSWNWPGSEGQPLQVRVFSRAPVVRLQLNGRTVGEQKMKDSSITAVFHVPYHPGVLKAVAIKDGKELGSVQLTTAGKPARLRLTAERSLLERDRNDLAYVNVEVVDAAGNVNPDAEIQVHFSVKGKGELLAVGSASPIDMTSFRQPVKKTFRGRCLAIVRPQEQSGSIQLQATAEGLPPATITIKVK